MVQDAPSSEDGRKPTLALPFTEALPAHEALGFRRRFLQRGAVGIVDAFRGGGVEVEVSVMGGG